MDICARGSGPTCRPAQGALIGCPCYRVLANSCRYGKVMRLKDLHAVHVSIAIAVAQIVQYISAIFAGQLWDKNSLEEQLHVCKLHVV